MNDNDNVVIYTKDKEAQKSIISFLLSSIESIKVAITDESIEVYGPFSDSTIDKIIKKVIMEEQMEVVTMSPKKEKESNEKQEVQEEKIKEEIQEKSQEGVIEEQEKSEVKTKIYNFICEQQEITNAQVIEVFKVKPAFTSVTLKKLCDEGKIEKAGRGRWKLKDTEELKEPENTKVVVEDSLQTKQNATGGQEQEVLKLLSNGRQMTEDEISNKTGYPLEEVSNILKKLLKSQEIKKVGNEYKMKEDSFGIFKQDKYKVLLDYIMSASRFSIDKIRKKYPEEVGKLPELIEKLIPMYISEEKDTPESYSVHVKGRILYFIMGKPNSTFDIIKLKFNLISTQDISTALNVAVREGKMERTLSGGYKTIRMM